MYFSVKKFFLYSYISQKHFFFTTIKIFLKIKIIIVSIKKKKTCPKISKLYGYSEFCYSISIHKSVKGKWNQISCKSFIIPYDTGSIFRHKKRPRGAI
jgi:hypothetical protein